MSVRRWRRRRDSSGRRGREAWACEDDRRVLLDPRRRRRTGASRVRFAITSRHGGRSEPPFDTMNLGGRVGDDPAAVEANRTAVASAFDLPRERLLFMEQCHGADVARADGPWEGAAPRVDALVSTAGADSPSLLCRRLCARPARGSGRRRRGSRARGSTWDGRAGRRPCGRRARRGRGRPGRDARRRRPVGVRPLLRGAGGYARRGRGREPAERDRVLVRHPGDRRRRRRGRPALGARDPGHLGPGLHPREPGPLLVPPRRLHRPVRGDRAAPPGGRS